MREHRPRKRFGQNFLCDDHVIDRILAAINPRPGQHLIEIGPGEGALTAGLLDAGVKLDAIELDRDLGPVLEARFGQRDGFSLHQADALGFDFSSLASESLPFTVVGNLPYNISTPLIFHLLNFSGLIDDMYFMLQREVVQRLAAEPNSKAWGKLGVMARYRCDIEALFDVAPESFRPPPKVMSGIVRLTPKTAAMNTAQETALRRVVTAAFSQRRKTLRNTLRDLVSVQQLEGLGIASGARAESLTLEQFVAISETIEADDSHPAV
ncbi:MAG: 16S rRNA (adenine(1518)-N(6)/adenine(1519)-N(6))-dimethyltransferase RsmA [Pseudomonadota bacterium]